MRMEDQFTSGMIKHLWVLKLTIIPKEELSTMVTLKPEPATNGCSSLVLLYFQEDS